MLYLQFGCLRRSFVYIHPRYIKMAVPDFVATVGHFLKGPPGDQRRGDRSRSRDRETRVRMNISNLPHDMDEAELKDTVANYGKAGAD